MNHANCKSSIYGPDSYQTIYATRTQANVYQLRFLDTSDALVKLDTGSL
ncbi:hypothetical protein [Brevibacillus laterosporus]|nr:hypothetical protein [Brevibacillus laterosporus]